MTKGKYNYIINLLIQLLLNILCVCLTYKYIIKTSIPIELYTGFFNNLYLNFMGYMLICILIIFEVLTIIFIIIGFAKIKKGTFEKSNKKPIFIIPIVFIFALQLAFALPAATQKTTSNLENKLLFDTSYSENISDFDFYYTCIKNPLAKAGYLEKFYNENNETIRLLCSYQQTDYKFEDEHFEKISEKDYSFKNKEENKKYTLYYETNDNTSNYALTVIENNYRYISIYQSENSQDNSYSIDDFVNDSLTIYNEWNDFG